MNVLIINQGEPFRPRVWTLTLRRESRQVSR